MSNNEGFDGHILSEKLSKLNNSQQSIESLSRWCISHRKKAKQIVETWDKYFNSSQKDQRVSFLYLANDILQNSRRKGSEFVNEFWKVLPAALKHVYENGDDHGKKAAMRLVDIWDERKVFGSRGQTLKDEMTGKNPPPPISNGKISNPIKIVKRDAHSVRIKLAVGGLPEKILTALQPVLDEHASEEAALNKCSVAAHYVGKIEEEVENNLTQGTQQRSTLLDDLKEQEDVLNLSIGQLEAVAATRSALVLQLKEALQDQEPKLEAVRTQLQVTQHQIEKVSNIRRRLSLSPQSNVSNMTAESTRMLEPTGIQSQPPNQPVISFAPVKITDEENKKAAAAAVAAKLAASTSSAQMLTSVLSSLVAEEAASMFSPEKRQKLEKSMSVSDGNAEVGSAAYFTPLQQQTMTSVPLAPSTSMQTMSQANQMQSPFGPPPLPPAPSQSSATPPSNQYVQTGGLMVGVMPYGYGSNNLPPPPPMPPHISMGLSRPTQPQQQSLPQQQQQQQQVQPASGGYYRPLGMGFYGQSNQSASQPVPRQ
ncbi:hypothetical protein RchiOBHm_Chr3g0495551 [Rosa chinensis]|uniref:CID domain-containing protein n=2 Tax=Rosa chinensis TaxID=74649 RepID=A0A2P6RH96_ROSCH|nr:histone acetyltransferase KAT6A isoform X1 [Rosa chinensis]PRQ45796.1 hypothetical protein RchiOBHm_Chr3g0495551 [Rosa chinensis]